MQNTSHNNQQSKSPPNIKNHLQQRQQQQQLQQQQQQQRLQTQPGARHQIPAPVSVRICWPDELSVGGSRCQWWVALSKQTLQEKSLVPCLLLYKYNDVDDERGG
ncbi:hypothetical protein PoB_002942500 [Plakobranchus ocellatus]|uniref:Uncharacterized protein n=1 Tax=Plakobranchus ocellatus TaxID=259542 RepID=A0AAV4A472_9GAST|nr:hypothetical protein PoB_002942500 [Plakobranchus ocellatus]